MTKIALFLIRLYQLVVSPDTGILRGFWWGSGMCRFEPSCSEYARQAVEKFGVWGGLRLALGRLARCHPWGGFGYDPVKTR